MAGARSRRLNTWRSGHALATAVLLATAIALAATLVGSAPRGAVAAARYTITGRGWGHGVGMSQWGAYGYARKGWTHGRILAHYYPGVTLASTPTTTVRVLLVDGAAELSLSASSAVTYAGSAGATTLVADHAAVFGVSTAGVWVRDAAAGRPPVDLGFDVTATVAGSSFLRLMTPDANGIRGRRWRGRMRVLARSGRLQLVDVVGVQDYLRGVVPVEVSPSWPLEAIKAQAIAARSYALSSTPPGPDFDLYCTVRSQYYGGRDVESPRTSAAVGATRDKVAQWQGAVARTYFFSSSGGRTEAAQNVWGGAPVPYLRSVADPYDTYAPQHVWPLPAIFDEPALRARLATYTPTTPWGVRGDLRGIRITSRGASPRVRQLELAGSAGTSTISGERLRSALGLRSTWFSIVRVSLEATPATVAAGRRVRLLGSVKPRPRSGLALILYKEAGSRWRTLSTTLSSTGALDIGLSPRRRATYQLICGGAKSPRVSVALVPAISIEGSRVVDYGQRISMRLRLRPARPGTYADVRLRRNGDTAWSRIAHLRLTGGATTFTVGPGHNAALAVSWPGDASYGPARAQIALKVRALVTLGMSRASVTVGQSVTLSGVVVPTQAGREVLIQRRDGGTWATILRPTTDAGSAYSVAHAPTRTGTEWLRVYLAPTPDYVGNASPQAALTVR